MFWPQEWLPLERGLQDARILTFGYNALYKHNFDISDFAKDLVFEMEFGRDENGKSLDIGQVSLEPTLLRPNSTCNFAN